MNVMAYYNVREYGAIGNGQAKDTQSLQRAIDACESAGGGTVLVPAGLYLTGTLYLKSDVELRLSAGATLIASPDREDYNRDDQFPENKVFARENVTGAHLIIAYNQVNVSITGQGTIDGNSERFFGALPEGKTASYRYKTGSFAILDWRPGQMIWFCRCRRVAVRDVKLIRSTYWNLFLLGCEDVQVRGITIDNPAGTQNGDGIDIDCSRNVTVSDCIIRSGDDCITIRANKRVLEQSTGLSENIAVANCVLSSPTCAFRLGVGDGEIRNCTISNIVVREARTAVNMVCRYSGGSKHGTLMEQIHFSDFTADVCMPIVMVAGEAATAPAGMRDISFSRFRIVASAGSQMAGTVEAPLSRIRLSDFDWCIRGGTDNLTLMDELPEHLSKFGYHGMGGTPALPFALYGVGLEDVVLDNIRIRWDRISGVWQDGLFIDRSSGIEFRHVHMRQPKAAEGAALRCRATDRITLHGCRATAGTSTFLQVERSSPTAPSVRCMNSDLSEAEQPFQCDTSVTATGSWTGSEAGVEKM